MRIGIFAKTFVRDTVEAVLDAVAAHEIRSIQFNMACAGLESMPRAIPADTASRVRSACAARGIEMAAVSGTFNVIHPDPARRADGFARLDALAAACVALGTRIVTLSTGTRDPDNMWRRHPDNDSADVWRELCASMELAVKSAERHDVVFAFEPEVSNVVDSARKARRLLDDVPSSRLRVLIDAANLFHAGELPRMRDILQEAFDLLGDAIVLAHAKDLSRDGEAGHEAAGTGVLDYNLYIELLQRIGYDGALILHNLSEQQVPGSVAFLRDVLKR